MRGISTLPRTTKGVTSRSRLETYCKIKSGNQAHIIKIQNFQDPLAYSFHHVVVVLVSQPDLNPLQLRPDGDHSPANIVAVIKLFADECANQVLPYSIKKTRSIVQNKRPSSSLRCHARTQPSVTFIPQARLTWPLAGSSYICLECNA